MRDRESWVTRRVLVTGSNGYLGSCLVRTLRDAGHSVRCARRAGSDRTTLNDADTVEGDVTDPVFWGAALQDRDTVVHLAAQTSAYVANADPLRDLDLNVRPMYLLLEAARRLSEQVVVVFAGAATQVGMSHEVPVDESVVDEPITAYDLHKLHAEQTLLYYHRLGVVRGVSLRLANVYGPGPSASAGDRGVLNLMIKRAIRGEDLTVYGDGQWVRDYVFVDDVAAAFEATLAHVERTAGHQYLVGSGQGHTVVSAIELVASVAAAKLGRSPKVVHVPMPKLASPIETRNFVANTQALQRVTGWRPTVTLEQGIARTFDAFASELS